MRLHERWQSIRQRYGYAHDLHRPFRDGRDPGFLLNCNHNFNVPLTIIFMLLRPFVIFLCSTCLSLVCALPRAFGQYAERDFTRYTVRDGLSDNGISCLQQDDWGYLWIGTEAGLNRFDGTSFKKFYQGTPPLHLRSGGINQLIRLDGHRLGIITRSGFHLLDVHTYEVKDYNIADSSALTTYLNLAWDAEALPDGSFAVTTAAGFNVFDADGKVMFRHDAFRMEDIGRKRILYGREIFRVDDHQLLVYVHERGHALYDIEKKSFRELNATDTAWSVFSHAHLQGDDHLVVKQQLSRDEFAFIPYSGDNIIYYNHALKKKVVSPLPFHVADALSWVSRIEMLSDSIMAINHKTKGFYLLRLNRNSGQITGDGKLLLPDHKVICLYADKDYRLWVGTPEVC